ncbi:hypothetical protein SAMN05421740_11220 [Parapedobacter koreensis]|uniref:Uncharacterized protein n=1 Tax=Parapedobacter koreensis TaxID=332977 RepID=A0A1H7TQZ8_9SPHI|nr:hypothetical protein SAMN05421740_11220 [Parapedobacter koreensis]
MNVLFFVAHKSLFIHFSAKNITFCTQIPTNFFKYDKKDY